MPVFPSLWIGGQEIQAYDIEGFLDAVDRERFRLWLALEQMLIEDMDDG